MGAAEVEYLLSDDKFLSLEDREAILASVKKSSKNHTKKYNSTFDIPLAVKNYTDAHGKTHPIWAKNLFNKEWRSFDEIFKPPKGSKTNLTSAQTYTKYVQPHAECLHRAWIKYVRARSSGGSAAVKAYIKEKMACYKAQIHMIERLRGLPLTK